MQCFNGSDECDTAVIDAVTEVTKALCQEGCEALPEVCNAYTYQSDSAAPHAGQPGCYLWKKCKEDIYDTEQESELRCVGKIKS